MAIKCRCHLIGFNHLTACFSHFSLNDLVSHVDVDLPASLRTHFHQNNNISSHLPHVKRYYTVNASMFTQIFQLVLLKFVVFPTNIIYQNKNVTAAAILDQLGTSDFVCFKGEIKSRPLEV